VSVIHVLLSDNRVCLLNTGDSDLLIKLKLKFEQAREDLQKLFNGDETVLLRYEKKIVQDSSFEESK
jgi:hypothetical protein